MMPYSCELGAGQKLNLENLGSQTIVTLSSASQGQQQQSSSRVQTGEWTAPPEIFQVSGGVVIKIATAQGNRFIQIQGNSLNLMTVVPSLSNSRQMQVQQVAAPTAMPPMTPMQPMTMGDMQMDTNSMKMSMGNLSMQMPSSASNRRFCSQCGTSVKLDDRFCANCGHRLS